MADKIEPIPTGYHSITPYLIVDDAKGAMEFYQRAFGAAVVLQLDRPDGKVAHAEVKLGDSMIMLADEASEMGYHSAKAIGGSPVKILLYIENVDAVFNRAVEAGAEVVSPVKDQFYGDRSGALKDPFGHSWTIATHIEDVSQDEVDRRYQAMMQGQGAC